MIGEKFQEVVVEFKRQRKLIHDLMHDVQELQENGCESGCQGRGCVIRTMAEAVAKSQPFFLNECAEASERPGSRDPDKVARLT